MRRSLSMGLAVVASAITVLAHAQTRDPAAAEALFKKGVELMKADDWKGACPNFEASMKLDPSVGTQLNVARCALHDGRLALGWAELKRANTINQETTGTQRKREIQKFIDEEIAKVEPRLPWITLEMSERPEGLTITRDGVAVPVDTIGTAIPIDPGKHSISASAPGYRTLVVEVEFAEAARKSVKLELVSDPTAVTPPVVPTVPPVSTAPTASPTGTTAPTTPPESSPLIPAGIAVASVGGAALVVSLVTGLVSNADFGAIKDFGETGDCVLDPGKNQLSCASDYEEAESAASRGETLAVVSTVTMFAGGAIAATGLALLIVGATQGDDAVPAPVVVVPNVSPTHAGVSIGGRF